MGAKVVQLSNLIELVPQNRPIAFASSSMFNFTWAFMASLLAFDRFELISQL